MERRGKRGSAAGHAARRDRWAQQQRQQRRACHCLCSGVPAHRTTITCGAGVVKFESGIASRATIRHRWRECARRRPHRRVGRPPRVLLRQPHDVRERAPGHEEDQGVDPLEGGEIQQEDTVGGAHEDVAPAAERCPVSRAGRSGRCVEPARPLGAHPRSTSVSVTPARRGAASTLETPAGAACVEPALRASAARHMSSPRATYDPAPPRAWDHLIVDPVLLQRSNLQRGASGRGRGA